MQLPPGMSEAEVLAGIEHAVRLLAPSFTFGYYDLDDIKQQARIFCMEALPRYDSSRPLENFMFAHLKNRLINFRRDKYKRNDPPCSLCHAGRQNEHADGQVCERYRKWKKTNSRKANLMSPIHIDNVADEYERTMRSESEVDANVNISEMSRLIDDGLPAELRSDYLRMKAGEAIPKTRQAKVKDAVRVILKDYIDDEEGEVQ